jgi:hypothetical protein
MSSYAYNINKEGQASQMCVYQKNYDLRVLFPTIPGEDPEPKPSDRKKKNTPLISDKIRVLLIATTVLLTFVILVLMVSVLCLIKNIKQDGENMVDPRILVQNEDLGEVGQ